METFKSVGDKEQLQIVSLYAEGLGYNELTKNWVGPLAHLTFTFINITKLWNVVVSVFNVVELGENMLMKLYLEEKYRLMKEGFAEAPDMGN